MQWLKNSLRKWLLEDSTVSTELIVVGHPLFKNRRTKAKADSIAGRQLLCSTAEGAVLVSVQHAEDEVHFWKLWKQLGGGRACWPDGTPYDPST